MEWIRMRWSLLVVGICGVVVAVSFALSLWAVIGQARASAIRAADRKAASVSQVSACYQQMSNAPKVLKLLGLIRTNSQLIDLIASNSIMASTDAISATPGDPLNTIRGQSIKRLTGPRNTLRRSLPALDGYIAAALKSAPKEADCRKLADQLGVKPTRPKGS